MTPTSPIAAVPAQPDALQIESAYEGEALIGYRITGSGNPDSRALVWIDQKAMPGIRDGNEFVPGYGKRIDYRPLSLHAQVAALTAQGAAERAAPAKIEPSEVRAKLDPTANPDEYALCVGADMWNACIDAFSASHAQAPAGAAVPLMTAEEVNALPAEARAYIHQLEANTDPAGMVRENMQLCDTNAGLQAMYRKAADALKEVIGCFGAASDEGLAEALAETTDERLKDLLERRLMYALYAAQEAVAEPTTAQAAPAAGAVAAPPQPAQCTVPPLGWRCTRAAGHEGPCAAVEDVGP